MCKGIAKSLASYINTFNLTTLARRKAKRPFSFVSHFESAGDYFPKEVRIGESDNENESENKKKSEADVDALQRLPQDSNQNSNQQSNQNSNQNSDQQSNQQSNQQSSQIANENINHAENQNAIQNSDQIANQNANHTENQNTNQSQTQISTPTMQQTAAEDHVAAPLLLYRRFSSRGIQRVGLGGFVSSRVATARSCLIEISQVG